MNQKVLAAVSLLGFILMVAGFVGYVFNPVSAFQYVFGAGVVMLGAGYALIYMSARDAEKRLVAEDAEEDEDGYFYILDEGYSSAPSSATIEDMTGRE